MMRNSLVLASLGAIFALSIAGYGCSSSSDTGTGGKTGTTGTGGSTTTTGTGGSTTTTGTGGSTTTTGTGGSTTGTGGGSGTGTGGASGTGTGGASGTVAACAAPNPTSPGDGTACTAAITCTKNCGPNTSALGAARPAKACTCPGTTGGVWACNSAAGSCVWPAALAAMPCFSLTPAPPLCPMDTSTTPATLIRANLTTCTNTAGSTCGGICGSPTVASYLDSVPAMKMGYCVCINGVYRCASATEWAPQ